MGIEKALMAAGVLATGVLPSSGYNHSPETMLHVGRAQWVHVNEPVTQHYRNGDEDLRPGDDCILLRGSGLILKGGGVVYRHGDALGTECPDGAVIDLSPEEAQAQDKVYQAYVKRRDEVTAQVRTMFKAVSRATEGPDSWVDLVNPEPIAQRYTNGDVMLGYGDTCLAMGEVEKIGELSTGEAVMRVTNPYQLGTACPTGALYLDQVQREAGQ